jgi:hypothetical protein
MLDAITDTISHFIGYFHLSTEGDRLRADYERFRHERAKADELPPFEPDAPEATAYDLEGYRPDLDWQPANEAAETPQDLPEGRDPGITPPVATTGSELHRPATDAPAAEQAGAGPGPSPELSPPPPGSLATVTVQVITLTDNDVFGDVTGLAAPESFAPKLAHLVEAAHGLSALEIPQPTGDAPWAQVTEALKAQVAAAARGDAAGGPQGAAAASVTGDAATGIMVDAQAVDAMPTLADHLPAFHLPDEDGVDGEDGPSGDPSEEPGTSADRPGSVGAGGFDGSDAPPLSGHEVIAGGNAAVNEVELTTTWLDAAVIAVEGNVTQIDAIGQVNVLSDADDLGPQATPQVRSELLNAAQIDEAPGPGAAVGPEGLPATCHVTALEGDLINFNWITQTSFVTDHDCAVITSTGSSTHIGLGANEVVNAAFLAEWGYQYDLILVGGDMVDVNSVTQTNVLLDDDAVVGGSAGGGDNLLFNEASIATTGIDSFGQLSSTFEAALDAMAEGAASMPSFVAQDGLFTGLDALNVLYVAGDFVTMNLIEQVNIVGDNDQVTLAAEAALANPGGEVEVTAGANLLANMATIHDMGLDSVVMAGGDVYTDALIHQAEFVSPDASPTGVAQAALATEAVAFLADGMIDGPGAAEDHLAPATMDGGFDVLQTMLS